MTEEESEIKTEPDFFVACAMLVDRAYGGPEEGGWYYDVYQVVTNPPYLPKVTRTREEAEAWCYTLAILMEPENKTRPPISSVLSEGRLTTMIFEGEWPIDLPRERPRYE